MIILFIILGLIGVFYYLTVKYNNPYKLTFIFGKKGGGKSTLCVKYMLHDLKHGWNVYTNMPDINIPGVRYFDTNSLINCVPDPHSAIYIDEGGLVWDNRNYKKFDSGYTEYFKLQRKYKNKVIINSQSFDIDIKIRQLTDRMMLVISIGGFLSIAKPIYRSVVLTEPIGDAESRIADRLRFAPFWKWKITWLPGYFKFFDSFAAPARSPVPFREVPGELKRLFRKNVKKSIKEESELINSNV